MKLNRRGLCAALMSAVIGFAGFAPAADAQTTGASLAQTSSQLSSALPELIGLSSAIMNALPQVEGAPSLGGNTTTRNITVNGMPRQYNVVLPAGYTPGRAYPVIIGFGGWQHSAKQAQGYEKLEHAAGGRAIVVYAQGVNNAWGGAPYASTSVYDDVKYTRTVVNDLARSYSIDRGRIYAAGLSNGGGMAAALACHAPDLVAGVASVAGAYYNPTVSNCSRGHVRTLIMHADNDDIVAYGGGVRHGARYKAANAVYHAQGVRNRCDMGPNQNPRRVGNATYFHPSNCANTTRIVKVHGGGHTWFTSPSATNEVVRFFLG